MTLKEWLGKISKIFQPAYNKIDDWDLPWLREACKGLWVILDDEVKKALFAFIIAIYKKYGEAKAKEIIDSINKRLS